MKIREYEASLNRSLRQATITLLLKDNKVLLAMKKRGFGVGKWNGAGGKANPGEDIKAAAVREAEEEIRVTPLNLKKVGVLNFYFPHRPDWSQQVHVFTAANWKGRPTETEEMQPRWFSIKNVPYKEMWEDDEVWMPKVFSGMSVRAGFMFGEDEKLADYYFDKAVFEENQK
jgi:8-oxo-dGTP pyrophosphatase MutT (NUDIX family)